MSRAVARSLFLAVAASPFIFAFAQQSTPQKEPLAEQVFKNIKSLKGVPASDIIPAMEFMSASLKFQCEDCHDPKDFAADNQTKETTRHMIAMQRDINAKNFNNRNEVTCMTCHRGAEHPVGTPIPDGVKIRHQRMDSPPKPDELLTKFSVLVGKPTGALVRTGTLTAPDDATHKIESKPLEFIQAPGGKFRMVAGDRKIGSDGAKTWYGPMPMDGEPAAIFSRIGRSWREGSDLEGLKGLTVTGSDTIGKNQVVVVRGTRAATTSTEELSFDAKSNLLARLVNIKRSSLGNVVSAVDYSNYKTINGIKTPMKVVMTFAGGEQWIMEFKTAKIDAAITDSTFKVGG